jgi:hypothetical protein
MAHSSRASTRSSPTKVRRSKKASKPAKGSTEAPARKISSLALDALDEFHRLRDLQRAYGCLERLMAAAGHCDVDQFDLTPGEIGPMLLVINDALRERALKVDSAIKSVIEACGSADRPFPPRIPRHA